MTTLSPILIPPVMVEFAPIRTLFPTMGHFPFSTPIVTPFVKITPLPITASGFIVILNGWPI